MPLTILVVEDHPSFRRLVCTALARRAEFQIVEAADGLEAVWRADEFQPHVILLDIHLPKLDGFEVAKEVRALAPNTKLVFLSQESSPEIVQEALDLGADGYIHKVSVGTDLLPAIDSVLAGRRFVSRSVGLTGPAAAPDSRRHEIVFCPDDAAIVEAFTRFVADALNAADGVIALTTETNRLRLLQALRAQGLAIDSAVSRGTCLSFDADVALDPVLFLEAIDSVREAASRAGKPRPRVAFCGERAGRLWADGRTAEAIELEQRCGELPDGVDILCAYPVPYTEADRALARVCAEHTAVSASG